MTTSLSVRASLRLSARLQPTRSVSLLDRVSVPTRSCTVPFVSSLVKSDHKAIMAISSGVAASISKTRQKRVYRPKTPSQNAGLLQHLASIDVRTRSNPALAELARTRRSTSILQLILLLYTRTVGRILPGEYHHRDVARSAITASIKAKLRRKNTLMRAGRVEEVEVLARQIGRDIARRNKRQLAKINSKPDTKVDEENKITNNK